MVNVKVRGEKQPIPVQMFLAAGESDPATSGHIFMDNLRIMHVVGLGHLLAVHASRF